MTDFAFTEEQLNYFKLTAVVLDEIPKALRNIFVTLWNKKHGPVQTWDDTPASFALLQSRERPTKTALPHCPIKEWDCTPLMQVTLYSRNFADPYGNRLCNLVPKLPSRGFHPSLAGHSQHETLALALDQLRILRNTLCHRCSTTGIDQSHLQYCLQLTKDAFSALGESTAVIDTIMAMTSEDFPTDEVHRLKDQLKREINANEFLRKEMDCFEEKLQTVEEQIQTVEEQVQYVKGEVFKFKKSVEERFSGARKGDGLPSSVLPSSVPHFTGRKTECSEIVHHLTNTTTRIVGVVGSPGFGKTSIAKTVAHQISSSNTEGHVYYVSLQGLTSLESLTKKLLTMLNPSILASLEMASGTASVIDQLQGFARDVHQELFLLLDNADGFVETSEFLRFVSDLTQYNSHLRILYTSRKPLRFPDIYVPSKVVTIKELTRNEGADLVASLVSDMPRESALELSESCGNVPLALHILCSTLHADHITVEELLTSREDLFMQLLNTPDIPDDIRFQNLFDNSFGRLSESVQKNFLLLAVFHGSFDAAAASTVLHVYGIALKKSLAELETRSLLEYDNASKRYRLHPLLHSYCRSKVQDKEDIQAAYEEATRRFFCHFLGLFQQLNVSYQSDDWQSVVELFEKERENIYETLTQSVRRDEFYDQVNDELVKIGSEFFLEYVLANKEYEVLLSICLDEADKRNDKSRRNQIQLSQLLIHLKQDLNCSCSFPVSSTEIPRVTSGRLLCYKGRCLTNQNKMEEGVEPIQEGVTDIDARCEDPVVKSLSLYFLTCMHQRQGNHQQAKQCQKEADKVCLEHGLPRLQIGELDRFSTDDVKVNDQAYVDQEDASDASGRHPLNAQFCTLFSVIPVLSADVDRTLSVLYRVLSEVRKRKLGEDTRTAECYGEISRILTLNGDPDKDLPKDNEALRIYKAVYGSLGLAESLPATVVTCYTLGGDLFAMGNSSDTLKAFDRSGKMTRDDICRIHLNPRLYCTSNGAFRSLKG